MNYNISGTTTVILLVAVVWELTWKAIALWKAAKRDERGWFIALLILNTAGILPILYLLMKRGEEV